MSLSAENVTLEAVLLRISERTKVRFEVTKEESQTPVSLSFQALPLEVAIGRVLRGYNYIKLFARSGDIHSIVIIISNARNGESNGEQGSTIASSSSSIKKGSEVERRKIGGFPDASRGIPASRGRSKSLNDPNSMKVEPLNNGNTGIVSESTADEFLESSGFSDGTADTPAGNGAAEVNLELGRLAAGRPTESSPDITKPTNGILSQPVGKEELKTSNPDIPMVIEHPTGVEMKIGALAERMTIEP